MALVLWMGRADAGRKRIVVLDFEGPKAEKFHADVVKLIKKGHTVLTVDKWNEKAEEMDATAVTDKNIKKLAKKLKIDGVVTGKIGKRRDEYIIRLKLRAGTSGELVGNSVQTKAEGPRLDAQAQRDVKDELIASIEELESNRSGGSEDEEEEEAEAPKKKKGADEEEEEDSPKKSGFSRKGKMAAEEEEEEAPPKLTKKQKAEEEKKKKAEEAEAKRLAKEEEAKKKKEDEQRAKDEAKKKKEDEAFASRKAKEDEKRKKDDEASALSTKKDEEEEEDAPKSKKRAKSEDEEEDEDGTAKKRKASREEDEESVEDSSETERGEGRDLSPGGRALDAVVGMSFTARKLRFQYQADLGKPPPGYKQPVPVAGAMIDLTLYPLSFSKGSKGILRGIGLNLMYDQVLLINSQKKYSDAMGTQQIANLDTKENRWAVGPVLRYPLGKMVVGGSLTYGKQQFTVKQTLPNNDPTDIPSVSYTIIAPAAFLKYSVTPKITANLDLAFLGITNTGQIQSTGMAGYGAATVTGYELEAGGDYMVTKNIFARVSLRYEAIGFKFKGDPTSQTNIRDTDPEQDVSGAKDTYMGGTATVGYVY
ncbi:MAG TPA: hypothetical protein VIV40_33910 [Kofleriaceae bacterium]